jgi:hypothetical protein
VSATAPGSGSVRAPVSAAASGGPGRADFRARARHGLVVAGVAALAVLIVLALIRQVSPGPSGPTGSSYATSATGLSAYAELLTRSGHAVTRLRAAPASARLNPSATLVMFDPRILVRADADALRRFVAAGGTLVAGGQDPSGWLARLMPDPPVWQSGGASSASATLAAPETVSVGTVVGDGDGEWSDPRSSLPVVGPPDASLLTVATVGAGRVELLADSSPVQNAFLARADNAALGVDLAGAAGRPVVFEEGVHGYGSGNGLAALPTRWKWLLAGLLLAALVAVGAYFRRLGPPDPPAAAVLPPRRAHVDALAAALARTGQPAAAAEPVRQHALALLRRRASLDAGADPDDLALAGQRLGLDADDTLALSSPGVDGEDAVLAWGRALAKLEGPVG